MPMTACLYGETGTYKTTELAEIAMWLFEKSGGKTVRMITADAGGYEHIRSCVSGGVIDVLELSAANIPNLAGVLRGLMRGMWAPWGYVTLNPGQSPAMPQGGVAMLGTPASTPAAPTANDLSQCGGYIIEGITSIGDLVRQYLTKTGAMGGEQKENRYMEIGASGQVELITPSSRMQYGAGQDFMFDFISHLGQLPVPAVVWSAHEGKGKDEFTQQLVYGIGAIGKAMTDRLPPKLGHLFHLEKFSYPWVRRDAAGRETTEMVNAVRAFFRSHPDAQNQQIFWPAQLRLTALQSPGVADDALALRHWQKVLERYPGAAVVLDGRQHVVDVLKMIEQLHVDDGREVAGWVQEVRRRAALAAQAPQTPEDSTIPNGG